MEEALFTILAIVAYIVLSILGRLANKGKQGVEEETSPSTVDRMLREMMRQAGVVEPEPPVPAEHRPTASEHRPTASEHRQAASETYATASEHRPTRTETRVSPSEHLPRASDHLPSPGEHLKGDVVLPPIPKLPPPRKRRRSRLADAVVSELKGGSGALGRAILLSEILGPPVSLRPPGEPR